MMFKVPTVAADFELIDASTTDVVQEPSQVE